MNEADQYRLWNMRTGADIALISSVSNYRSRFSVAQQAEHFRYLEHTARRVRMSVLQMLVLDPELVISNLNESVSVDPLLGA